MISELHRELADERREREQAWYAARHDPLTGLPNRLYLTEEAGTLLATPQPAVAVMDLDRFKSINDTLGHSVGDAVLVGLAARFMAQLDSRWLMARLGGDEFAAVREGPVEEVELVTEATALVEMVAAPMRVGQFELRLGCSIGLVVASLPVELSALLWRADKALYRSKDLGGRPVLWRPRQDDGTVSMVGVRPVVRNRDLRRARFGGVSVLVAGDAEGGGADAAVGRVRPASLAAAP